MLYMMSLCFQKRTALPQGTRWATLVATWVSPWAEDHWLQVSWIWIVNHNETLGNPSQTEIVLYRVITDAFPTKLITVVKRVSLLLLLIQEPVFCYPCYRSSCIDHNTSTCFTAHDCSTSTCFTAKKFWQPWRTPESVTMLTACEAVLSLFWPRMITWN